MSDANRTQRRSSPGAAGRIVLTAVVLLGLLAGSGIAADWDELRSRVLSQYSFRQHWNNVSGPPTWVGGAPIAKGLPMSPVTLAPGDSVCLLVPPDSFVRAYRLDGTLAPDDLEFWVSDGSGLQVRHIAFPSSDKRSLITLPDHPSTALVRVSRPQTCGTPLTLALFESYREAPGDPISYRTLACTSSRTVLLKAEDELLGERFGLVDPQQPVSVCVDGPVRLKLETHLRYPPLESEVFQSYQLRVFADGALLNTVDFETSVETRRQLCVGDCPEVLGQRQTGYVEVPPGPHKLTIDGTASVWLRVMEQDRPQWLLPGNRPPLSSQAAQAWGFLFDRRVSYWNLSPAEFDELLSSPYTTDGKPWLALRSARDNSRPNGPLRAYLMLRALAAVRPDGSELRDLAEQLRTRYAFYRDLLPVRTGSDARQRTGYFYSRHLRAADEPPHDVIVAEQHVDDLAALLPSARFTVPPNSREDASVYRLPVDLGPTVLQVVVDQNSVFGGAALYVQFDGRPPIPLVATGGPELPASCYTAGFVEGGLAALERRHGSYASGTLGGPFAQLDQAAPLLRAGTAELAVPAGVSEIRLWSPTAQSETIAVALRYLDSKKFRLTEMEYTEMAVRAGVAERGARLFVAALQQQPCVSRDRYAEQELRNHWHPLLSWLRQEDQSFRQGVVPAETGAAASPGLSETGTPVQPARSTEELLSAARAHADREEWLLALESWSAALRFVSGPSRFEALFGRMTALRQLGEDMLHETGLRGLFLFDPDEAVRQEAASRLMRMYRQTGDEEALLRLHVVRTLAEPSDANLVELAQLLADQGKADEALMLALVLPRNEQVTRLILRTTLHARWWRHYEDAIGGLASLQEQQLWWAWRCLSLGRYVEAGNHLQQAGPQGLLLQGRLQSGATIQSRLRQADLADRAPAVFDWERWSATSTAPQVWTDAEDLVSDYESSALLVNPTLNTHSQYYIGRTARPVTLVVQGPARLQITGRPLHSSGSTEPIDDWMIVTTSGQLYPTPINNNHIADGLIIADQPGLRPGLKVTQDLELGPGRHEVLVYGESAALAVHVERLRPERELPVLPPVNRDTIQAALAGVFGVRDTDPEAEWLPLYVRITGPGNPPCGARCAIRHQAPLDCAPAPSLSVLPPEVVNRVLLRLDSRPIAVAGTAGVAMLSTLPAISRDCSALERFHLLSRTGAVSDNALHDLPATVREAVLWRQGRGAEVLSLPLDTIDPLAVRRRLAAFLRLYEQDVSHRELWLARGESCFTAYSHLPDLRGIHTRLTQQSEWKPVSQIERSAGLRTMPITGWQPELPYLRVRKALLELSGADEQVITADQQVVLSLESRQLTRLTVDVQLAEPPYTPPSPLTFAWQIDDGNEFQQQLTPDRAQLRFAVDVPDGAHTVRIRCVDPWVNQFLRVRITESRDGTQQPVQQDRQRLWHVATDDESVVAPVEGPALIRIDELRDGATFNELRLLPEGLQRVQLRPSGGRSESLYRIYRLEYEPRRQPSPLKHFEYLSDPAPAPFISDFELTGWTFSEQPGDRFVPETLTSLSGPPQASADFAPAPRLLTVNEGADFLMEANGVWSASMGYFSRRPLLEGINGGNRPDSFFQYAFDRHHRYDSYRTWSETQFLFRDRVHGGQSAGLVQLYRHDLADLPLTVHFTGSGYVQHIPEVNDWEWSLDGRARFSGSVELCTRTMLYPEATVYARALSLNTNPFVAGIIDQDVFTTYKTDHRVGIILADRIEHRPWMDTVWWSRPLLVTTENFNMFRPDHMGIEVGWEQWVRPFGLNLSYRITRFYHNNQRLNSYTQQLLTLQGFSEGWAWGRLRCEPSLFLQRRLDTGANSIAALVSLTWDAGFNDWHFRPGEKRFQAIRKWRGAERRPLQPLDWW